MARKPLPELELEIESVAFGGLGVARPPEGPVVFVRGGLPGDRVRAQVTKKKRKHREAVLREVLRPGTQRVEARCGHQGVCGGCPLQCLSYEGQLEQKTRMVRDAWERVGGLQLPELEPILPCPEPWFYRNKMEFTFSDMQWVEDPEDPRGQRFGLGQHARGVHSKVFDLRECHLQAPWTAPLLGAIRDFVTEEGPQPDVWRYRAGSGFWRFVVMRRGERTGQILLELVTGSGDDPRPAALCERLLKDFDLHTVIHTVNPGRGQVAKGATEAVLHGPGHIHERLLGLDFRLTPRAFFQTNTGQAERLFDLVREMAAAGPSTRLLDLYCGSGAIGLCLARDVERVTGIEIVPEAIADARGNAERNGIANAEFFCGDVKEVLGERGKDFDLVVVDPPRPGLSPQVVEQLGWIGAPRLVYVSCNPVTQARDAALLAAEGYRVRRLRPVDMFPHTSHVETVALFERENHA